MKKYYIYTIHNILNNKIYVGKTINLKRRWSSHLSLQKNNSKWTHLVNNLENI